MSASFIIVHIQNKMIETVHGCTLQIKLLTFFNIAHIQNGMLACIQNVMLGNDCVHAYRMR